MPAGHQAESYFRAGHVVGTARRELLDRILILGERHLDLVIREYLIHYNRHRPHQSRRRRPSDIETQPARDVADRRSVRRKPVVTGVINEYHHARVTPAQSTGLNIRTVQAEVLLAQPATHP
jgi:hypothetical protein